MVKGALTWRCFMIVVASGLIAAGQWVGAQAGGGTTKPGGGTTKPGGGTTKPGGGSGTGGGNKSVRKVKPNNGYTKGVANYTVNTITISGRTIQPKIMVQDFTKRGMRILLRSRRWGGQTYPYLAIKGKGGGSKGGGGTNAPPKGGGNGTW